MKKIIAIALLSTVIAAPVLAENAPAKASTGKPAAAAPSGHKHDHKMATAKGDCDSKHEMGGRQGYGMMGEQGVGMMMEPNMHMIGALALSQDQQAKINKLSDELKHNNWATQGLLNDETAKLRDLYEADKRDPAAIGKEYQKVFDLKRQMIETYLDVENRIEEVLTPEQLAKVKESRHAMRHMYQHHMQ